MQNKTTKKDKQKIRKAATTRSKAPKDDLHLEDFNAYDDSDVISKAKK